MCLQATSTGPVTRSQAALQATSTAAGAPQIRTLLDFAAWTVMSDLQRCRAFLQQGSKQAAGFLAEQLPALPDAVKRTKVQHQLLASQLVTQFCPWLETAHQAVMSSCALIAVDLRTVPASQSTDFAARATLQQTLERGTACTAWSSASSP